MAAIVARMDVYTVMLGVAVLAILLAILVLIIEWSGYDFDAKAKDGKPLLGMAPPAHSAPLDTTATS